MKRSTHVAAPLLAAAALALNAQPQNLSKCDGALLQMQNHQDAVIERCEILRPDTALQAVIVVPRGKSSIQYGTPIRRLEIYRDVGGRWSKVLGIDSQIKNPYGYIGIDYVDDVSPPKYWIKFSVSDKDREFRLLVNYAAQDGPVDVEALPTEIGWNRNLTRYQEISPDGNGFVSEITNPPHRKR
jgi:hypothetical protein